MITNSRNVLKVSKTHLQPSGGRNECSDTFRKAIGVPIHRLIKRKIQKNSLVFWPPMSRREHDVTRISTGATVPTRCARMFSGGVPPKYVAGAAARRM